jgi:hypothetical protein
MTCATSPEAIPPTGPSIGDRSRLGGTRGSRLRQVVPRPLAGGPGGGPIGAPRSPGPSCQDVQHGSPTRPRETPFVRGAGESRDPPWHCLWHNRDRGQCQTGTRDSNSTGDKGKNHKELEAVQASFTKTPWGQVTMHGGEKNCPRHS